MLNRLRLSTENQLHLLAGLMNLTLALVYMAIPVRATLLGATPLQLGLVGGTTTAIYTALAILAGRISDRLSPKSMMKTSLVIYLATFAAMSVTDSIWLMILLMVPAGIALALFWPPLEGWLGAGNPPGRTLLRRLGYFNIAWAAGQFVGPIVAGYLYDVAYWMPFVLNLGLAGLILIALSDLPKARALPVGGDAELRPINRVRNPNFIYAGWLANFINYLALSSIRTFFPKLAIEIHFPVPLIGILLALPMLVELAMFVLLRRYHGWHYSIASLAGMQVLGGLALLGISFGNSPALFSVCLVAFGAFAGLAYYSSIYYTLAGRADTGGGAGIHETIIGIGFSVGSLLSGIITRWGGLRMPYLVIAVMMFLSSLGLVALVRKGRR